MHELSVAGSILRIVESAARREAFTRVRRLHLAVPVLAGVEAGALRFALEAIAPQTLLEGAELQLDEPASRARCEACGHEASIEDHDADCPRCGLSCWRLDGDAGLRVVELLVE